jgi:phosphomannomutase
MDYNGMKLVRRGSMPVSGDSGLNDIRSAAENGMFAPAETSGKYMSDHSKESYIEHLLSYIDKSQLKPLKIVVNAGNGSAGIVIDMLAKHLPFEFIRINHEPDGSFPNGIPNPLLPENRAATSDAVIKHGADLGIAWDGDFDRCFFFDENGRFIEGYYIVGMIAKQMLAKHPGSKIIHDPRLTWNTIDIVKKTGGQPVMSKTGHAFIKERMRAEDALYGGEMSSHHYFREFAYCDSGMIPWMLVAELLCVENKKMSGLVDEQIAAFPCSGEINFTVENADDVLNKILDKYKESSISIDRTDGLSMELATGALI